MSEEDKIAATAKTGNEGKSLLSLDPMEGLEHANLSPE